MVLKKELPKWLNASVVETILSKKFGDGKSCRILSVEITGKEESPGDHYLSEIIRFNVRAIPNTSRNEKGTQHRIPNGSEHRNLDENDISLNLIVKDMGIGLCEFIKEVDGVQKEISMYKDILPDINAMYENSLTPEMLYYDERYNSLVVDDLSVFGYRTADRIALLDYDHCKIALGRLAEFHAGSFVLYEKSPDKFDIVGKETMYNGDPDNFANYFAKYNLQTVIKILEQSPETLQFIDSVRNLHDTFWDEMTTTVKLNQLMVLNHGDFWTTNILYRYADGKPIDCKLIDFQMPRFCCPTLDLYQFITISMRPDVRDKNLKQLLIVYVDRFNEILNRSGAKRSVSIEELEQLMYRTRIFGLLNGLILSEIALCDRNRPLDLSRVTKPVLRNGFPEGNPYDKGYRQITVQNHIVSLLHFFRNNKYI